MKKLVVFAVLAAIVASCADDNPPQIEKSSELVSPRLLMDVSTESGQSPLTGILTIMPCKAGTSIYYGNYINRKLTPFYGYYQVKDGAFYNDGVNRELSLPAGLYNMIYWGTPKYEEPIYAHPLMRDPVYILGEDMPRQHFSLFKMEADTTYYPVFDLVHAVQPANIGSEDLKASLKRVVTGLKVIIKDKNNGILSSSIDSMVVRNYSIFRHDNFIGCFSADKIKMSVRKYFCFNIPVYKNMAEEPSCRSPYHEEYIQTSASGNPEGLCRSTYSFLSERR